MSATSRSGSMRWAWVPRPIWRAASTGLMPVSKQAGLGEEVFEVVLEAGDGVAVDAVDLGVLHDVLHSVGPSSGPPPEAR